ncbi:MAG: pyridoxamine 5'-phosphate oxidase family protein [Thermodesulfobacteriota bacterium]
MTTLLQSKAIKFLETERYAQLGTMSQDNTPTLRTMAYVLDNKRMAFLTDQRSNKVQDIQKNPNVSCLISRDHDDWHKSLQLTVAGKASQEADESTIEKIISALGDKYPAMKDLPQDPNLIILIVEIKSASLLDNSKGFLHVDTFPF